MRDNFTMKVKNILANRVGCKCSNPDCMVITSGPGTDKDKIINIGVASHISAASEGGPRYHADMTDKERKSVDNGIWLCQTCSKLIDSDVVRYPVEKLKEWKEKAEQNALSEIEGKRNLNKVIKNGKELKQEHTVIIKSFGENIQGNQGQNHEIIDLRDFFDGRFLKKEYTWDIIIQKLKSDICLNIKQENRYFIKLITHYSVAFMAGRFLNPKSGVDTTLIQKSTSEEEIWETKTGDVDKYEKLLIRNTKVNEDNYDMAIIISITRKIEYGVETYIQRENLMIGTICYCSLPISSIDSVVDGKHAWELAKQISSYIESCFTENRKGKLHIFISSPISLIFYLGRMSLAYGNGIIYDYNYEKKEIEDTKTEKEKCTYFPTIEFLEGDWI